MIDPRAALAKASTALARIASPYPCAAVLALAGFAAYDALVGVGPDGVAFWLSLAGLVLVLGVAGGLALQGAQALCARLPPQARSGVWFFASCFGAGLLAIRLGAFAQLQGRYANAAFAVLGACATGALGLGLLLSAMQPSAEHPAGYLASLRLRARVVLSLLLLAASVLLALADRTLYVGLYPNAHAAMRLAALLLATCALALLDAELRLPRITPAALLLILGLGALPFASIRESRPRLLEAFGERRWCAALLDVARAAVDVDADGYAGLLGGGDCAPFDHAVHPSAREIPGNHVDDNCMFGDADRSASSPEPRSVAREPSPIDVVLVTIDTLRADHMGVYNPRFRSAGRSTTPNLDRWSQGATVFDRAYTPGSWTSIAIASLMHGLYARRLQWKRFYETTSSQVVPKRDLPKLRPGDRAERMFPIAFDDPHRPLALRLRERGMKTVAIVDDGYTELLAPGLGIERGFDRFLEVDKEPRARRNDQGGVDLALAWLRNQAGSSRFFMWLHMFGPHGPNERHYGVPSFGNTSDDLYDHEIAFCDLQLKRLLDALDARKTPTAVVIVADHGELLYPTQRFHGHTLEEGGIHIPMIAKVPGWHAGHVRTAVSLIDLAPTVLALTRTPWLAPLDGIDLASVAKGQRAPARVLLTDGWKFQRTTTDDPEERIVDLVAAYDGERKLLFDRLRNYWSAYPAAREGRPDAGRVAVKSDDLRQAIGAYLDSTGGDVHLVD